MDHLPISRCASAHLRARCFSTGDYDGGPFASFPARHNWKVSLYKTSLEETFSRGGEAPSVEETEVFLQTWLYFGTLHEIFGECVTMSDFIAIDKSGNKFLYTSTLRQGCHTGHLEASWRANRAGRRVALCITPYMNRAGYCRQRIYCSKFTLL
jgi:hypothetical protein